VRPAALDRETDRHQGNSNELAQRVDAAMPAAVLDCAEIADRYTGLLHGIGRRYRLTPDERDDAAQSTWLALCQNADRIRDPDRIAGWLATTIRRNCTATLPQRHREIPVRAAKQCSPAWVISTFDSSQAPCAEIHQDAEYFMVPYWHHEADESAGRA
jgi:DNA-directed RNA polymerase specialized sigma24 family protein